MDRTERDAAIGNDGADTPAAPLPIGEATRHSTNGHAVDASALSPLSIAPESLAFDRGLSQWVWDRVRDGYLWAALAAFAAGALIVYMVRVELAEHAGPTDTNP